MAQFQQPGLKQRDHRTVGRVAQATLARLDEPVAVAGGEFMAVEPAQPVVWQLHITRGQVPPPDGIDQAILDALSDGDGLSTNEIAVRIARTPRAARTRFASLVERGLVREIGAGPQAPSGGSSEQYRNDISSLPTDSRSARAAG